MLSNILGGDVFILVKRSTASGQVCMLLLFSGAVIIRNEPVAALPKCLLPQGSPTRPLGASCPYADARSVQSSATYPGDSRITAGSLPRKDSTFGKPRIPHDAKMSLWSLQLYIHNSSFVCVSTCARIEFGSWRAGEQMCLAFVQDSCG